MLPTLVAQDVRHALTDYLEKTFALGGDDVRAELERFVADPDQGSAARKARRWPQGVGGELPEVGRAQIGAIEAGMGEVGGT